MRARVVVALCLALACAACASRLPSQPLAQPRASVDIVYVTPTPAPTLVPTIARQQASPTPEQRRRTESEPALTCGDALQRHYETASDHCLAGIAGQICSGGGPPSVEPASVALNRLGAVADSMLVDSLRGAPLGKGESGGMLWLRLDANAAVNLLAVGAVALDRRAADWRSFTLESEPAGPDCAAAPPFGVLIAQSAYGVGARLTINGVSAQINGSLAVLTRDQRTTFAVIEGAAILVAYGRSARLPVGTQLDLPYEAGDWSRPIDPPGEAILLEYALLENLPVLLFDRPLPIPQPGYAQTQGRVNMRAAPDIEARLLYQVPAGETMAVLGISSDSQWLHIRLGNGETGWMSAELLARNLGEIARVYDEAPPPPQRYGAYASLATVNVAVGGNLREAPDTAFRVKRTLPFGTAAQLLARSPYSPWVKVDAAGEIGWMALFTLETKAVIGSLAIDYDVPLPPRATPTPSFSYGGGHAYPDPAGGY